MNEWFFRNRDIIGFSMIFIVEVFMVCAHIREHSSLLNTGKWFIIIGLTIVLLVRSIRQKKNRGK